MHILIDFTITYIRNKYIFEIRELLIVLFTFIVILIQLLLQFKNSSGSAICFYCFGVFRKLLKSKTEKRCNSLNHPKRRCWYTNIWVLSINVHSVEIAWNHVKILVATKFGSCKYCGKGDIAFLICYMTSREHVIRESNGFMCWFPLP